MKGVVSNLMQKHMISITLFLPVSSLSNSGIVSSNFRLLVASVTGWEISRSEGTVRISLTDPKEIS